MNDLLEAIAAAAGTTLLSDLHENAAIRERIPCALRRIPRDVYPVEAWREAARYILQDNTLTPETEREARGLLEQNPETTLRQRHGNYGSSSFNTQ